MFRLSYSQRILISDNCPKTPCPYKQHLSAVFHMTESKACSPLPQSSVCLRTQLNKGCQRKRHTGLQTDQPCQVFPFTGFVCFFCQHLSAMSTFSRVGLWSSNGMRMCVYMCVCVYMLCCVCVCVCVYGMNLKYALCWHIHISVHSILRQCYTQAHTHPQTI